MSRLRRGRRRKGMRWKKMKRRRGGNKEYEMEKEEVVGHKTIVYISILSIF